MTTIYVAKYQKLRRPNGILFLFLVTVEYSRNDRTVSVGWAELAVMSQNRRNELVKSNSPYL